MHRFNMGNDNPIQNDKLLREAYQAGRQQALNEQGMGGGGGNAFGSAPGGGAARQLNPVEMAAAMYGPDRDVYAYYPYEGPPGLGVNDGPMATPDPGMGGRSGRRRNRRATQRLRRRMMGEQFGGGGTPPTFQQAPMNPMAYGTGTTNPYRRGDGGIEGQMRDRRGNPIFFSPYTPADEVDYNNPPAQKPLMQPAPPAYGPGSKSPPEGVPPVQPMDPNNPEGGGFSPQPGGMYYEMPDGTIVYGSPGPNGTFNQWGTWTPPNGPWRWKPRRFTNYNNPYDMQPRYPKQIGG